MAHKRKTIRHRICELLSGRTAVGTRVYANRPTPVFRSELPCVCVYMRTEPMEVLVRPTVYKRALQGTIEIIASANDDLDDALDDIAEEVENVLGENVILKDQAGNEYPFVEMLDLSNAETSLVSMGDKVVGAHRIGFVLPYTDEFPKQKETEDLDEFETADVQYETTAGHENAEAHDRLDLRP